MFGIRQSRREKRKLAEKEQSSGLYAQTLAERGFLALAFDPSFTGESGGSPRYMASPDNKELLIVPGAVHTDLYDQMDIIPWDKLQAFYTKALLG